MISPILQNAVDIFEHAIEHYIGGTTRDRKLAILHCDQAIELLLKEKLRSLGESIYLKGGQTLSHIDCLKVLTNNKGVKIPEISDLELIHDQRNILQHKGGVVSETDAEFYISQAFFFVSRFLDQELGIKIEELIDSKHLAVFASAVVEIPIELRVVEEEAIGAELISSILVKWRNFETLCRHYLEKRGIKSGRKLAGIKLVQMVRDYGIEIDDKDFRQLERLSHIRNQTAHTDFTPSETELGRLLIILQKTKTKIRSQLKDK